MINPASSSFQKKDDAAKCPDCDSVLDVPSDVELGEILSRPCCGLELEAKKTTFGGGCTESKELIIEGRLGRIELSPNIHYFPYSFSRNWDNDYELVFKK